MLPICAKADFVGDFKILFKTYDDAEFTAFINTYEKKYLKELLSVEAYNAIKGTNPTPDIYKELINETDWTDSNSNERQNLGLKQVLLGLIRVHWFIEKDVNLTKVNKTENETPAITIQMTAMAASMYNEALMLFESDVIPYIYFKINETGYEAYKRFNLPFIFEPLF